MKITFKQVRIGRLVKREFSNKEDFVSYMKGSISENLDTFEKCMDRAKSTTSFTVTIEE